MIDESVQMVESVARSSGNTEFFDFDLLPVPSALLSGNGDHGNGSLLPNLLDENEIIATPVGFALEGLVLQSEDDEGIPVPSSPCNEEVLHAVRLAETACNKKKQGPAVGFKFEGLEPLTQHDAGAAALSRESKRCASAAAVAACASANDDDMLPTASSTVFTLPPRNAFNSPCIGP